MPDLSIVIINWNGENYLKECIDSLLIQTYKNFNIIVVDNNSTDRSIELIEENYCEVITVKLNDNKGFAAAANIGIIKASEFKDVENILLLNNDTVCNKEFLNEIVGTLNSDKSVGMAACKMLFFKRPQYINNAGGMIRANGCFDGVGFNEPDSEKYNVLREVFAPSGGAGLYKMAMLKDIRYKEEFFDESFFAYHEDMDIAWRARLKGWKCYYNPRAVVYHHHSASFGNSSKKKYLCIRNNISCLYKCLPSALFAKVWWKVISYYTMKTIQLFLFFDFYAVSGVVEALLNINRYREKRAFIQNQQSISNDNSWRIWNMR